MRKRYISAMAAGVVSIGALGYFMTKNKSNETFDTMEKAGRPDSIPNQDLADLENSKMVSEGSQFGVQYYNESQKNNHIH